MKTKTSLKSGPRWDLSHDKRIKPWICFLSVSQFRVDLFVSFSHVVSVSWFVWRTSRTAAQSFLLPVVVEPRKNQNAAVSFSSGRVARFSLVFHGHDAPHQAGDGGVDVGVVLEKKRERDIKKRHGSVVEVTAWAQNYFKTWPRSLRLFWSLPVSKTEPNQTINLKWKTLNHEVNLHKKRIKKWSEVKKGNESKGQEVKNTAQRFFIVQQHERKLLCFSAK